MLDDLCKHPADPDPNIMNLEAYWHPRFNWYGPTGIGTALGPILMRQWMGDDQAQSLRAITIGFVLLTVGVIGLGLANIVSAVVLMTIVRGIGSGAAWVFSSALLQSLVTGREITDLFDHLVGIS